MPSYVDRVLLIRGMRNGKQTIQDTLGQFHKSGWWDTRLFDVCEAIGYVDILIQRLVDFEFNELSVYHFSYHVLEEPCLHMTAFKPETTV